MSVHWYKDGFNGEPSSMDVLLEWLVVPGNVARWLEPSVVKDGRRTEMYHEIYDLLLANGITDRSPRAIQKRLTRMRAHLDKAEKVLKRQQIRHFDAKSKVGRKVSRICPFYPKIVAQLQPQPLLQPSPQPKKPQLHSSITMTSPRRSPPHRPAREEGSTPSSLTSYDEDVGTSKRAQGFDGADVDFTEHFTLLDAESDVRCELLRLQIQVKRDEAICVRANARKELLDLGISLSDVDRLMPL